MTGGYNGPLNLDSSELYDSVTDTWTTAAAKLPRQLQSLRATNINNKLLIFGTWTLGFGLVRLYQHEFSL